MAPIIQSERPVHAVRKHILEILKEREGATVAELADALEMAAVSVRHHLDILQGDNLIRVARVERKGSVGRPQQIYVLTEEAVEYFPNNFAVLAGNLVRQIKQTLPPEQVECVFRNLARDLAGQFERGAAGDERIEAQLERIAEFLNSQGYLASWEENADGEYFLHKHNCPYAGVSAEHRELCTMDQVLIETLTARPCERVQHMVADGHSCTYRIGQEMEYGQAEREADVLPVRRTAIALVA
jgi:predicted ArsR family transcriptional regulator